MGLEGTVTMGWGQSTGNVPICVDGRMIGPGGTGVSTYARSLAEAVGAISEHRYLLVARRTDDGPLMQALDILRNTPRRLERRSDCRGGVLEGRDIFRRAHIHFKVRRRLYRVRCDVPLGIMHWTYPVPMMMEGWINLYTVHDAIPFDRPDLTPINARRHRAVVEAIVAHGDGITTVSQSARRALVSVLGCRPEFVADTGQPVNIADAVPGPLRTGLVKNGYFLVVGSVEPRKNLATILAAFRYADTELPLVVVGPDGWRAGPILADIAATPRVIRIAYAERDVLLGLIQNARALIFPSLAEGFGLPIVEAMALGTPVLTSDRDAPAEIAGDAALTVDPTNIAAISAALIELASDEALNAMLSQRGIARAAMFSRDRFVGRLGRVYDDALQARADRGN